MWIQQKWKKHVNRREHTSCYDTDLGWSDVLLCAGLYNIWAGQPPSSTSLCQTCFDIHILKQDPIFTEEFTVMYRKLLANRKLLEMAIQGQKQTVHDRLPLYFWNKGAFSRSSCYNWVKNKYWYSFPLLLFNNKRCF